MSTTPSPSCYVMCCFC